MPISFGAGSDSQNTSSGSLTADSNETYTRLSQYNSTWYPEYTDENTFTVTSTKNVITSQDHPNLSQETNSQYIPFVMPRFYDGIDLTNMTIQIHFVNANNDDFIANPVNVEASENHIRFGWLVDERATVAAGKLQFEIKIFGVT